MVWLFVISLIFIAASGYIVFAPFYLEINTVDSLLVVGFHRLAKARVTIAGKSLILEIKIAGWTRQIDLLKKSKPKENEYRKRVKAEKRVNISFNRIMAVTKSFKVNRCYINIDTGNVQLNGVLYPIFYWIKAKSGKNIGINFTDENVVILNFENNIARIIRAYFFS